MTTPSKTKSHFERLLSEIYARWFCKNNQQKCIDCLKPRSNKNERECKKSVVAITLMYPIIKVFNL